MASSPDASAEDTRERYVELGTLLKRKRPPEQEAIVNDIIKSDLGVEEKLRRLKELDGSLPFRSQLHHLRRQSKEDPVIDAAAELSSDDLSKRGIYTSIYAKEKRKRIKQNPRRSGFFEFLFRDYPRLSEFADRTGVIECSFFPPSIRPGRRIEKLFVDTVCIPARDIIRPLAIIEEHGWLSLTKLEYNLIIEFKRLVERIITLSAEANRDGESGFFPKLRRLELNFLVCHGRHEWPERILSGMESVLKAAKAEVNIVQIIESARKLLVPKLNGASLYAMILALTVVDKRRMIDMEDIVERASGIISNYNFECPPAVERSIAQRVESLIAAIATRSEERRAIMAVKAFVRKNGEDYDFAILRDLIAARSKVETMVAYAENVLVFAAAFARAFLVQFEQMLAGTLPLADGSSARLFSPECFQHTLNDLTHHADKLERLARVDQHIVLTRERIAGMIATSVGPSPMRTTGEVEALQAITRLSSIIASLGEDIAAASRGIPAGADARPMELIDLKRGAALIPAAQSKLAASGLVSGETVAGALLIAATICHTAALFMQEQKICALLNGETRTSDEIRRLMSELERLAVAPVYESVRDADAH